VIEHQNRPVPPGANKIVIAFGAAEDGRFPKGSRGLRDINSTAEKPSEVMRFFLGACLRSLKDLRERPGTHRVAYHQAGEPVTAESSCRRPAPALRYDVRECPSSRTLRQTAWRHPGSFVPALRPVSSNIAAPWQLERGRVTSIGYPQQTGDFFPSPVNEGVPSFGADMGRRAVFCTSSPRLRPLQEP